MGDVKRDASGRVERVAATQAAAALIESLKLEHGPLLFHQSGGCCDGSAPMCFARGDFKLGQRDVLLGMLGDVPFFIGAQQFEYWAHTHLTVDVVAGRGAGFSAEGPRGVRFIIRSRVFTDEEYREQQKEPPLHTGPLE